MQDSQRVWIPGGIAQNNLTRTQFAELVMRAQRGNLEDGSGRITVFRSKTDAEAQGAVVAITPAAVQGLSAIRPAGGWLRDDGVRAV